MILEDLFIALKLFHSNTCCYGSYASKQKNSTHLIQFLKSAATRVQIQYTDELTRSERETDSSLHISTNPDQQSIWWWWWWWSAHLTHRHTLMTSVCFTQLGLRFLTLHLVFLNCCVTKDDLERVWTDDENEVNRNTRTLSFIHQLYQDWSTITYFTRN